MRSTNSCLVLTRISRSMLRVILLNKFSTGFSHEPCLGVVEDEPEPLWPACQVGLSLLGEVRGVVIQDQAQALPPARPD